VAPRRTGDALSVHLHRATVDSADVINMDGVLRTTIARTVVDIAREHGWIEAVVVGDAALARGMTTTAELDAVLAACARWPGICRARRVVAELDGLAESPLESVSRLRIRQLGLPPPQLQAQITDARGVQLGRVDFYWPELGVIGEVDGRMKYAVDPETALWEEKRRQERLEDTGLIVVRWGKPELDEPELLRRKLLTAFGRAAHRRRGGSGWGTSGVPGMWPDSGT
jgi:very-short-patch-repair endonuclease